MNMNMNSYWNCTLIWNELPRDIAEADNFQLFKSKLKLYLIFNCN